VADYTPGPWHVGASDRDVYDVDGEPIAFVNAPNARLVAAAPDLLAALEDAVGALDACEWGEWNSRGLPSDPGYGQPSETLVRARAAIAKAKGSEIVAT
jgi:hypothetical protein